MMIDFYIFTLNFFQDTASKTYDRLFRKEYDYNNKLHRDDREHAKSRGLTVNSEVNLQLFMKWIGFATKVSFKPAVNFMIHGYFKQGL